MPTSRDLGAQRFDNFQQSRGVDHGNFGGGSFGGDSFDRGNFGGEDFGGEDFQRSNFGGFDGGFRGGGFHRR